MVAIRFVLLLILSMALEISGPLGPDVMENLESAYGHARLRVDRDADASAKRDPDRTASAYRPSKVAGNRQSRPVTGGWVRKLPPAASDSASSPEDH